MKVLIFLYIFLFCVLNCLESFSQEIEAKVSINLEQIPQEYRHYVSTMESDVTKYINSQRFTNIEWEGPKIPVDINIALSGGNRGIFAAQMKKKTHSVTF